MVRSTRDGEGRENEVRSKNDSWMPSSALPVPNPEPGYKFRYIRTATRGEADVKNVSSRIRDRWEPVKAADHPELEILPDPNARFGSEHVEIGGLVLCKTAEENVERRNEYYAQRNDQQMETVDSNYLRQEDRRMPLHSARRSRTTFGSGGKE